MRNPQQEALDHYRALLREVEWLSVAMCWTIVVPDDGQASLAEVVDQAFGAAAGEIGPPTHIQELPYGHKLPVSLGQHGTAISLFENNGLLGAQPPVLTRISTSASVYSVYWNINGDNSVNKAAKGQLLLTLDAMEFEEWSSADYRTAWPELQVIVESVDPDGDDWQAGALAAAELATGVRLDREWLTGRQPCVLVDSLRSVYAQPAGTAPTTNMERVTIPEIFAASPEHLQFQALTHLARTTANRFDLVRIPIVGEIIDLLANGAAADEQFLERVPFELVSPVATEFSRHEDDGEMELNPRWRRMQAAIALDVASRGPGARPMGFDAFHHAEAAFGDEWPEVQAEMRAILQA